MQLRIIVIAIIVGMWMVGMFQMQANPDKNGVGETPNECIERSYGCFNEYDLEYNEDDIEYEDGITTP